MNEDSDYQYVCNEIKAERMQIVRLRHKHCHCDDANDCDSCPINKEIHAHKARVSDLLGYGE
jgi:hypothetical protein